MIDSQPVIPAKRSGTVIPPRIMSGTLCVHAKRIYETPVFDLLQSGSLLRTTHNSLLPQSGIMHVTVFWRYIEVTTEKHGIGFVIELVKERPQAPYPLKLKLILFRTNSLSIRDIDIYDLNAVSSGGNETSMRLLVIAGVATVKHLTFVARSYRHSVVGQLAEGEAVVTMLPENVEGK